MLADNTSTGRRFLKESRALFVIAWPMFIAQLAQICLLYTSDAADD